MTGRATATGMILCAAAGLAIGWGLDRGISPARDPGPGASSKSDRRGPKDLRPSPPGGVTARVGRIGAMEGTGRRMKAAYALALTVPVERIEEWLEGDYFDTADSKVDTFFYRVLYERYLDADPEAFLTRCLRKNYESSVTKRYMSEWTRRDPVSVREFLESQGDPKKYRAIAEAVVGQLASTDKAAALELIGTLSRRMGSDSWPLKEGLRELAKDDPDRLMLAAQDWSEPLRKLALDSAARAAVGRDFLGGVAWIQEHAGAKPVDVMRQAVSGQKDVRRELLAHAAQLPDGWLVQFLRYDSWSLARDDPEKWLAADAVALGVELGDLGGVRSQALEHLVRKDWDKAEALLRRGSGLSDRERKILVKNLAGNLASRDKDKATAWMECLGDPILRETAQSKIDSAEDPRRGRSPGIDPAEFIADAVAERPSTSSHRVGTWTRAQTAEAVEAFTRLDSAERTVAATNFQRNAHYLPLELRGVAMKHLIESAPAVEAGKKPSGNGPVNMWEITSMSQKWAAAQPVAAARWVETLPAGPERDKAAAVILGTWRMEAPREAERWLEQLPRGGGWEGLRGGDQTTP